MTFRPPLSLLATFILCLAAAALFPGCGKKAEVAGATASETVEAFAAALDTEDFERAATAFDYVGSARKQNEDWDDIPAGQRKLIIGKLTEQKAGELAPYRQQLGANIECGSVAQGNVASLTGDAGSLSVELRKREGKWYVFNVW